VSRRLLASAGDDKIIRIWAVGWLFGLFEDLWNIGMRYLLSEDDICPIFA
jgi:hypothetical protein